MEFFLEIIGKWLIVRGVYIFLVSKIQHIFGLFWRFQQKNWWQILKSVLKVGSHNVDSEIYFFFKKSDIASWNFFLFLVIFLLFFSSNRYSVYFERKTFSSESRLFNQLLKLIWECGISFSSGTFKNGLKCARCRTINFVQGSGEAHAVWKLTFSSHHSFDFKRNIYNSESTLFNQLLKLIWGCGISFSAGAFTNGQKCTGCWTIIFL